MGSVLKLIHGERKRYYELEKFHYLLFSFYVIILVIGIAALIFAKIQEISAVAWISLSLLLVVIFVEAYQIIKFRDFKNNVDNWYLETAFKHNKK